MQPFQQAHAKRTRILIHALIISGTLNFALIATFITFVLKERKGVVLPIAVQYESIQQISLSNGDVLSKYFHMSFEELVKELYDETHVEHGYRRCDLALSCLTAFHYFDLERALSGFPLEKRQFAFVNSDGGEEIPLSLYPGLDEGRFKAIRIFARTEVWPLTPFGLYQEMRAQESSPTSLKDALMMTSEVYTLKRKLHQLPLAISDDNILDLIKLSEWPHIENFTTLPAFLMPCIEKDSKLAAYLLVLLEKDYALKQLDNEQIEKLITLLTEKTPEVEAFLAEVSEGIRPESVKELAGAPPSTVERSYIVQQGDSLWKISREFDVKIEVLRTLNSLESDNLKPGTKLTLPSVSKEEDQVPQSAKGCI